MNRRVGGDRVGGRTIALDHERLNDIVADHLEVGVTDPVGQAGLGTSEEVVDNGDIVAQEHETVDEMGADETSTTGDEDALALGGREKFHGREAGEGGVGDGLRVWVVDGL